MAYIRFIVSTVNPDSEVEDGIFGAAYALRDAQSTSKNERELLVEQLKWFAKNLPIPKRFNRSASKGFYRRKTKGIAWFRDDALEHISRMHEVRRLLEASGYVVHVIQEDRVGYVVYTDSAQVIAEPFADTRTGA
jgi:hypothetical protein